MPFTTGGSMTIQSEQRPTGSTTIPGCCAPAFDVGLTDDEAAQLAEKLSLLAHQSVCACSRSLPATAAMFACVIWRLRYR